MPTTGSGPISIQHIRDFFGRQDINGMSQLYRGGAIVPDIPQNAHVPASGTISMQNMYNTYRLEAQQKSTVKSVQKSVGIS